nr:hypothetical protein Puna18p_00150 [Serratia proteamaculans]
MKTRFPDQQIISILREAEGGVSPVNFAASTPFPTPRFTPGVKVWRYGSA